MPHIFTGSLTTRAPTHLGTGQGGWFHVVCYATQRVPCCVALDQETLLAGGGDRLDPGSSADIYSNDGIWVVASLQGAMPIVSVELRNAPTILTVDPQGQKFTFSQFKGMSPRPLEPGKWHTIASNIVGMNEFWLRADGGIVWVDSHADLTKPPHEQTETGSGHELRPDDGWFHVTGNPNIYAYVYSYGVDIHMTKLTRGVDFVVRPK